LLWAGDGGGSFFMRGEILNVISAIRIRHGDLGKRGKQKRRGRMALWVLTKLAEKRNLQWRFGGKGKIFGGKSRESGGGI